MTIETNSITATPGFPAEICKDEWKIFYIVGVADDIDFEDRKDWNGVWQMIYYVCVQCDGVSYDNKAYENVADAVAEVERLEADPCVQADWGDLSGVEL